MSRENGRSTEPGLPDPAGTRGRMEIRLHRSARRRAYLLAGLGLVLAGMALMAGLGSAKYRRVRTCAESTLDGLRALQGLAPAGSLDTADLDLTGLGVQLRGLQEDLACLRAESGG